MSAPRHDHRVDDQRHTSQLVIDQPHHRLHHLGCSQGAGLYGVGAQISHYRAHLRLYQRGW